MRKRKLRFVQSLSIIGLSCLLTACQGDFFINRNSNVYTEDNMNSFRSDKVKVEDITDIEINTAYSDVEVIASDDYYMEYQYYYIDNQPLLTIHNGTLTFDDSKMNQGGYSINLDEDMYLKIYIPTGAEFENVNIHTSSGEISLGSFSATDFTVDNSYGDVIISGVRSQNAKIGLTSGKLEIKDCSMMEAVIDNSYGDVTLTTINTLKDEEENNIYGNLKLAISSGDLEMKEMSFSSIDLKNSYGNVDVENLTVSSINAELSSGACKFTGVLADEITIHSSYGDTTLGLIGREPDYRIDIGTDYGKTTVGDKKYEGNVVIDKGGARKLEVKASSGDVAVAFLE